MIRRRAQPEAALQRAVLAHLEARAVPGAFWFHPPNGGARTRVEGAILKGLGVRPGVPDLILLHDGRCYALELKSPGGRPSPAQRATIQWMERAGAYCAICEGLDRALAVLEAWGLLRGSVASVASVASCNSAIGAQRHGQAVTARNQTSG